MTINAIDHTLDVQSDGRLTPQPSVGLQTWAERIAGPGVLTHTRFDTQAEVDDGILQNATAGNVSREFAAVASGNGALRFEVLNSDQEGSGDWRWYLKPDQSAFVEGDEFYVQYRQYIPKDMWNYVAEDSGLPGSSAGGWKQSIISSYAASFQQNEVVVQNTRSRGFIQAYHQSGAGTDAFDELRNTPCQASNFALQPAIDAGVPASPSTCLEYANRYGPIWQYGDGNDNPGPTNASGTAESQGHPRSEAAFAGVTYPPNGGWITVLQRIKVGTWGTPSSEVDIWVAQDGENYVQIISETGTQLGDPTPQLGFDALWLLPFETNKAANTKGVDTFVLYDEVIVSTQFINAPVVSESQVLTELQEAALKLQPGGNVVDFSGRGMTNDMLDASGGFVIIEYATRGYWDESRKAGIFVGGGHGSSTVCKHIEYDDSANFWFTIDDNLPGGFAHAYEHNVHNSLNGELYHRLAPTDDLWRKTLSGPWGFWDVIDSFSGSGGSIANAVEFFPDYGAQGGLVVNDASPSAAGGTHIYDFAGDSWQKISSQRFGSDATGRYHTASVYLPSEQVVLVGGGNGNTGIAQVNSSGAYSGRNNAPDNWGVNNGGIMIADPGPGQNMLLFTDDGNVYEHDYGADSWGIVASHPFFQQVGGWIFMIPVTDYGVIMAVELGGPLVRLWKR